MAKILTLLFCQLLVVISCCNARVLPESAGDDGPIDGGYSPVNDLTSDHIKKLVDIALAHLDGLSEGNSKAVLVKLEGAEEQVVSGTNTKLHLEVGPSNCSKSESKKGAICVLEKGEKTKKWTVVIFEQPWTKTTKVIEVTSVNAAQRWRRSSAGDDEPIEGGYNPVQDLKSNHIKKLVDIALAHLDRLSHENSRTILVKLEGAERQVVSGTNTKLHLDVGLSNCSKSESKKDVICVLEKGKKTQKWTVVIFEQPWTNTVEVTEAKRADTVQERRRRQLGGYYPIEVNSREALEVAHLSISALQPSEDSQYRIKLIRITKAEQQVVAGTNTRVTFQVGLTNCHNSQSEMCDIDITLGVVKCTAVLFSQPWTRTEKLTELDCAAL